MVKFPVRFVTDVALSSMPVTLNMTFFEVVVAKACEVPALANSNPDDIDNDVESLPMI